MTAQNLAQLVVTGDWTKKKLKVYPSDFSQIPQGTGVYGYQQAMGDPLKCGPLHEAAGGMVFFDNGVKQEDFTGFLRMMDVPVKEKKYAVFMEDAANPGKQGFLRQVRFVDRFALRYMFRALDEQEYNAFPEQSVALSEGLWLFMESEQQRWGRNFWEGPQLAGLFGGDGYCAREKLSFGFMVENDYHHVYRMWSRAWLVTK
ncbi:MAG: hypothetical protein Q7R96_06155 [Nanoarchaeota archaeon]|nr:hypothetical protein [Nanoarchaeota archaeon]